MFYINYPCSTISSPEHPTSSFSGFLQASSKIQNDIVRNSSGSKNVCFTASLGAPREFRENIPKEGLRKITKTNIAEIKEILNSHGVLNSSPWELFRKIIGIIGEALGS